MYKILHIPSGTYLKIHRNRLKRLILIPNFDLILNDFVNKIWSEYELKNAGAVSVEFFNLKLPTIELANIYLKVFIEGIVDSVYFSSKEERNCYNNVIYYEIVEE